MRRPLLIGLLIFILASQAMSLGLRPAYAQSCDVTVNVAVGTGPTCVNFDVDTVTYNSGTDPGDPDVFTNTVYLQFLTSPNTCVDISVDSEIGWTAGGSGHLNYLTWDCDDNATAVFISDDSAFHGGYIPARHQFMWASPTPFSVTIRLHPLGSPPPSSLTQLYDPCPELGNDVAIFTNPSLWGPGLSNPTGESKGLVLTNKRALIQVLILPDHKYKIKLIYHETDAADPSQFTVQLADSPFMFVPLDGTTDSQTFLAPEANYVPDSVDHANFALASQLYVTGVPVLGRDLIIDYACLFDTEPNRVGSTGEDPNGRSQEACSLVTFQGTSDFIENARRLIAWLWQGLKSLFDCVLRPLLAGIWQSILNGLAAATRFFLQLSTWLNAQIPIVWTWLGDSLGNLWRWLVGILGNLLQIALNAAAILLNNLGLSGLVNGIIAFIESLPQFFQSAIRIASIVFEIVGFLITRLFQLILSIIGIIPIIVTAMIDGFNNSSAIPFWAPSCSSSNTILSGPCLGFYILDNTVFDGPIFYIFILIDGLVAVNALIWAVERVKKALTV